MNQYPKRLIEVDLPIKRISAHARREKSIRHGHISTLHIWWARRPLAACRAVICASLWFDPADEKCPESFREAARVQMRSWGKEHRGRKSPESFESFEKANKDARLYEDNVYLRGLLLDFIADFANWDNSTNEHYLTTSRSLTDAAHIANGGEPGTRPLVVDPFAGGGAIPLEALRVGADAFASDLNPVAVLLNKVVLEYIPKYGQRLADEVRKWGAWVTEQAEKELAEYYPKDPDGSTPIAYLWARTIVCEGPGCGAEVPMLNQLWIKKKGKPTYAYNFHSNSELKTIESVIVKNPKSSTVELGTTARGSVTCPLCGYTTPATRVRQVGRQIGLGERLLGVVLSIPGSRERKFRMPEEQDFSAIRNVRAALNEISSNNGFLNVIKTEIPLSELGRVSVPLYGLTQFKNLFTERQQITFQTLQNILKRLDDEASKFNEKEIVRAIVDTLIVEVV